jgi:cytochrome bd ubiquinol oxidase subunit I
MCRAEFYEGDVGTMSTALVLSRAVCLRGVVSHFLSLIRVRLAAWLTVLKTSHLISGRPVYRRLYEFWIKIFGVTFGLGL